MPHRDIRRLVELIESGCEDRQAFHDVVDTLCGAISFDPSTQPGTSDPLGKVLNAPCTATVSSRYPDHTPLEIAVMEQNTVAAEVLLDAGASADAVAAFPCTALCKCCYAFPSNTAMISTLLRHGASPDATTIVNDASTASCLIISVMKENIPVVKLLLASGADVAYEWKGANALSMALDFKKLDIAEILETSEWKRAKNNRWKRFVDRKNLEEQRERDKEVKKAKEAAGTNHREDYRCSALASQSPQRDVAEGGSVDILNLDQERGAAAVTSSPLLVRAEGKENAGGESSDAKDFADRMSEMEWVVDESEIESKEIISAGAHGEVYGGTLLSTGDAVAIKKFPYVDEKSVKCFIREASFLSRFRHENIVMFKGAVISRRCCYVLSELCDENLLDCLSRPGEIPWPQRLKWASQICRAMTYLHSRTPPVVHRDLKSMNVLLDANKNVKLCDFGMARTKNHTFIATEHIAGSPAWMAPEVLRGDDFNDKSDVYGFGVILWELLTRQIPWPDKSMAQLVGLVGFSRGKLPMPKTLPPDCPSQLVPIIESCWELPENRPTFRVLRTLIDNLKVIELD